MAAKKKPRPDAVPSAKTPTSRPEPASNPTVLPSPKPSPSPVAGVAVPAPLKEFAPAPPPLLGNIPWTYGAHRMTAMARDPEWIFMYWEVGDPAIEEARQRAGDPNAACTLRIYDTTDRDFNGLNPHGFWDIEVARETREYTVHVGRPSATVHVDIGVRAGSGLFVPIARSGPVEMPRNSVSPDRRVEWSTVPRSGRKPSYQSRYVPRPGPGPSGGPPAPLGNGRDWSDPGMKALDLENVFRHFKSEGWTRTDWTQIRMDGPVVRYVRWSGPFTPDLFPIALAGSYRLIEIHFHAEERLIRTSSGERLVWGPWYATLEVVTSGGQRKTIHQWRVRHRWTTEQGSVRTPTPEILTWVLGGERVLLEKGGSEERLLRESWGSELLQAGASERHWVGASETLFLGSSEVEVLGASEQFGMGASESMRELSSGLRSLGASELWALGGSGQGFLAASDGLFPTGADQVLFTADKETP